MIAIGVAACADDTLEDDGDGTTTSTGASSGNASSSSSTGSGIPVNTDPDKHGFPDDVYAILQQSCTTCHSSPPKNGAPNSLEYYEDTQAEYYTTGLRWWSQIREHAIFNKPPSAPFQLPPLPQAQKDALSAWIATCGPDDKVADLCAKGTGTPSDPND